ncbi:MAG: APC family permease [Propionibacteriaceae bacterium]|jgi:amino acid transporter|nr:APC family permease [Propionibacteriaceae bacterium]
MSHSQTPDASAGIEQFGYKQELKRRLTFGDLLVYGLIFMVPIAPFAIFGSVFQASGGMVALSYLVGMVGMMLTANAYRYMAAEYPMSGSVYTYVGRGLARPAGFVAGWMILLDYILVPTLLYTAAAMALAGLLPGIPIWVWVVIFVILNTVINYLGIEFTAGANKIMLVLELIVLAVFLVIGVIAVAQGKGRGFSFDAFFNSSHFSLGMIFGAVSIAVLSFLGFDGISTLAEENASGPKAVGRSMIAALGLLGVLFVVQTWVATMLVDDPEGLIANGDPAGSAFYEAARLAGGSFLFTLTSVATAIAWGFANALAAQAATSRLLFAMARDRQLPHFLAKVHPQRGVPVAATFAVAAISLVLGIIFVLLPDGLGTISTMVNFGALTAFLLLNITMVWHFAVKGRAPKILGHIIVPVAGAVVLTFVLFYARIAAQTVGLIWLAVGIVLAVVLYRLGRMPDTGHVPDTIEAEKESR